MIKLLTMLLALPLLLSIAPVPAAAPVVYHAQLPIVQSAMQADCTFETAPARLRQTIEDPIGYPYGEVSAWSCSGDTQAVIAELNARAAEMQSQAAVYRAAHPIGGVK